MAAPADDTLADETPAEDTSDPRPHRVAAWVSRHGGPVIVGALVATAALVVPLLAMPPDDLASTEPPGPVFEARDELAERFGAGTAQWFFIAEAVDGDILDPDGLLAVAERADAVRHHTTYRDLLLPRSDPASGAELLGVASFADTVDAALTRAGHGGLAGADDDTVRGAVAEILDDRGTGAVGVSQLASRDDATGRWSAPALTLSVLGDGTQIERSANGAGLGSDREVEEVGRGLLTVLTDTDDLEVHGVAVDQNLTAQEQGEAAGPFIGFTVLAIVLLVGLAFRSYWVLAITGGALASLLVWLQGLANLIGLKDDQILSTVVPIAMIAFGVDYAFHAVGRYREERSAGHAPRRALARGLGRVAPALLLALATGAVAFLANTASSIESIVQFGLAAAIALASAFVVLGVVVPAGVAMVEERVGAAPARPGRRRPLAVAAAGGAAATAMAAVLLLVFLHPPAGVAVLAAYLVVFVALPAWLAGRRAGGERRPEATPSGTRDDPPPHRRASVAAEGATATLLTRAVLATARRRAFVLPAVGVVSLAAAYLAVQVPASFDVEDFFSPDTGFVIGLDKLDEHVGDQGGEPAEVLVVTDLDDPPVLTVLTSFTERLAALDTPLLAHDADGDVEVDRDGLDVLTGGRELTAAETAQVLAPADEDGLAALQFGVGIVGSRAQENVEAARALLEPLVADLDADLTALHPGSQATLTGTPIVRQASLDAVSRSLQVSLPIAILLCLLCVWLFLRSLRYAVVAIVPILLVVAWLYGFMELAGHSINLVTATIGAVSIGIGIDFAAHMTVRYREELAAAGDRMAALRAATAGTGVALVGSTVTSAVGFAILALAPMPMFASFGLLTAIMIVLALVSSLLVLPGLLLLVSRQPAWAPARRAGAVRSVG